MPSGYSVTKGYEKAEELGIISSIPLEQRVKVGLKYPKQICQYCNQLRTINNGQYQLCSTCCAKLREYGQPCAVVGCSTVCDGKASVFYHNGDLVCESCRACLKSYNLTLSEYQELRNVSNCGVCGVDLDHQHSRGNRKGACLDHDHDTGKIRGVLCQQCNVAEGYIKASGHDPVTWAKKLILYLQP